MDGDVATHSCGDHAASLTLALTLILTRTYPQAWPYPYPEPQPRWPRGIVCAVGRAALRAAAPRLLGAAQLVRRLVCITMAIVAMAYYGYSSYGLL